jgi:hypothetical protein
MLELFLNPWSMAAGALLVSVPIIIHLINRMRFKRVKWAAMEFLLKAQKRMKRKLIFQQLLLLFLRCFLILLLGVLVGRFLGFNPLQGHETRTTAHVVVLDDSPSMGDVWRGDDGQMTDAFGQAKKLLGEQIAPAAAEATTPQTIDLIRLSDLNTPRSFGRLNTTTIEEIKGYLAGFRPTPVRGGLPAALKKAKEVAESQGADVAPVVHVLSDFRSGDWEEDGPAVKQTIEELTAAKVKVHLIDVAHPFRKDDRRPPLFHDNVGIVEFRPSKAVVARYESVEFTIRVRNFGGTELKDVRFAILVNGDENKGQSVSFPTLPANQEKMLKFNLTFDRVASQDRPLDRFSLVTARLETPEPGGIAFDNLRHAVVEVREKLQFLAIEGRPQLRDKKEGDGFYLNRLFTSSIGGITWVNGTPADLEKAELRNYSLVLLLNVPSLSEAAAKNLEQYVRDGGGAAFFLGPDVKPGEYNKFLYADGNGVFPVPLPERPTEPLPDDKRLERLFTLQKKLLLRDKAVKAHPALFNIYFDERGNALREDEFEKFFSFVIVGQYWPVKRLGKWRDDPNITELYCMPNEQPMGEIEPVVKPIIDKLPVEEPKYAKYKDVMVPLRNEIRKTAASTEPLYKLANLLDRLLSDQRSEGDKDEALIREFWAQPELADLKTQATRLRDAVKFGDPLYLAKQVGRGRVAAIMTSAGEQWTDWPTGPGKASYVGVMIEMERYLSGGGTEDNRSAGDPVKFLFDATRYKPQASRAFTTFEPGADAAKGGPAVAPPVVDLKEQTMATEGGNHVLNFTEAAKPGVYMLTLTRVRGAGAGGESAEVPEYQAFAVNVDARREGDLRRAGRDDVTQFTPGVKDIHSPGDAAWLDLLKNKQTDLTEAGWIFLAILLVLLVEQALAVKLSYHSATGTLDAAAPSAAALYRHTTSPEAGQTAA